MKQKVNRYFPHDIDSNEDEKIMDMIFYFKTKVNDFKTPMLQYTALGLYWTIIQYLHIKEIPTDKLEIFADKWQVDVDFLKTVLEKFNLFKIKNGNYISERVLKNIQEIEEKSSRGKKAVSARWKQTQKDLEIKKEKNAEAQKILSDSENFELNNRFIQLFEEYRTLEETEKLEALNLYKKEIEKGKNTNTAIKNMIKAIKEQKEDKENE